jgi:hypothetical protein
MYSGVKYHTHLNGLFILAASTIGYSTLDSPWWLYFALLLAPDLFMLGYIANANIGARIYNLGHSYLGPLVLITIGVLTESNLQIGIGCIWAAHIGLDHIFGYGYKYPDAFKHTHFSEI